MDWIRIQQPMNDVQRQGTNPAIEIEQISANKSSTVFWAAAWFELELRAKEANDEPMGRLLN